MTSRKLIICLLASMVVRNPLLLKMRHISMFLMVKFILIKSPDEWATTKQACRDELVVYLSFSSIYTYIYIYIYM